MFYKASDAETSTRDWFKLSFNTIPWALLAGFAERGELEEAVGDEPDEPDEDDFEGDPDGFTRAMSEYEDAYEAWKERSDNAGETPMWSYVWEGDDCKHCVDEARAVGLRVMSQDDLGTFFAADSAGHSFFGAYWIPLRARIAAHQIADDEPTKNVALCAMLAREYRQEGEGGVDPCGAIGALLGVSEPTIEAARKRYAEGT